MTTPETRIGCVQHDCAECQARKMAADESRDLSGLLARIHRDGGHYEDEHGRKKALDDAHLIVANMLATDGAQSEPESFSLRGELAKSLTCWHRLTEQEANELVSLLSTKSAHKPADGAQPTFTGPAKWTDEEVEQGHIGIRWINRNGVQGRPTPSDVRKYLSSRGADIEQSEPTQDQVEAGLMVVFQCTLSELGDLSQKLLDDAEGEVKRIYKAMLAKGGAK